MIKSLHYSKHWKVYYPRNREGRLVGNLLQSLIVPGKKRGTGSGMNVCAVQCKNWKLKLDSVNIEPM